MRTLLRLAAASCLALGCAPSDGDEIVVTREQLGRDWPLEVNSAFIHCGDDGAVLRLGIARYALDEHALAQGLPDAREVAARRPHPQDPEHSTVAADLAPLRAACNDLAHVAAER